MSIYQLNDKVIYGGRRLDYKANPALGKWEVYTVYRVGKTYGIYRPDSSLPEKGSRVDRVMLHDLYPYSDETWQFVQSHMMDVAMYESSITMKQELIMSILEDRQNNYFDRFRPYVSTHGDTVEDTVEDSEVLTQVEQ